MRYTLAIALVSVVSSAVAAPLGNVARYAGITQFESRSTLVKRGCNPMPSKVDPNMRDIIYKTVRKQTKDPKVLLITMVTAYTESMVNNLNCGDKDSLGLFQQRPSQGWGSPDQIQDPVYSTNKFLQALNGVYAQNKDKDAGVIAQIVQVAEAGNQYTKNLGTAQDLVRQAAASVGDDSGSSDGNGGDNNGDNNGNDGGDNGNNDPKPTSTGNGGVINAPPSAPTGTKSQESETPSQTDAPSNGSGSGESEDDGDCDDTLPACQQTYVPVLGDNCYKVADMHGLTLDQLYKLNPDIDSDCQNLYAGQQYCVKADDV